MTLALTIYVETPDQLAAVAAKLGLSEQTPAGPAPTEPVAPPAAVEPASPQAETPPETKPQEPTSQTFTAPQVKATFIEYFKKNGDEKCKAALAQFSVSKISDLPESKFSEFMKVIG